MVVVCHPRHSPHSSALTDPNAYPADGVHAVHATTVGARPESGGPEGRARGLGGSLESSRGLPRAHAGGDAQGGATHAARWPREQGASEALAADHEGTRN